MSGNNESDGSVRLRRRTILKGAAVSGVLLPTVLSQSSCSREHSELAQQTGPNSMQPFIIDVHHHAVPSIYVDEMNRQNYVPSHGKGFPKWSPQTSLHTMDQYGIAAAVTSVSSPGVYIGNAKKAVALSRSLNEYSAAMSQEHPGRMGFFAILPLPVTLKRFFAPEWVFIFGIIQLSFVENGAQR